MREWTVARWAESAKSASGEAGVRVSLGIAT